MKDAKGHGSNKRGIHSAAVDRVGNIPLHPNVLDMVRKKTDFSVQPMKGTTPKSGFMVSLPGYSKVLPEAAVTPAAVQRFAQDHAGALQQPGAHIGRWKDTNTGEVYLDVSHNIKNKNAAIKAGKSRNQIAIWDVKHGREIKTGGTGK